MNKRITRVSRCYFKLALMVFLLEVIFPSMGHAQSGGQWSKEKIWNWYRQQPWICGVNYIPRNAINYTAMWDKTSFLPIP